MANISDAAKLQSASASHIATTMTVVQEITSQTTTATFDTARSVSELANMAESLRESVTDFKLPDIKLGTRIAVSILAILLKSINNTR